MQTQDASYGAEATESLLLAVGLFHKELLCHIQYTLRQ
jgi:hypothetical protein